MKHRHIIEACRVVLRDKNYTAERSAALIGWLRESDPAICDMVGRALAALGEPAFDDLLACVTAPGAELWPSAVWALELVPARRHRLLPLLRGWLASTAGELQRQCAVSLANLLVERWRAGHSRDPADVAACRQVLERDAGRQPALRVHLWDLVDGLGLPG
ncbi:MAG TPA: hypothetical protein VKE40_08610 [Gemmataceae bacterium]|nr:hypothetical protein [Gemmataceae bacterium]